MVAVNAARRGSQMTQHPDALKVVDKEDQSLKSEVFLPDDYHPVEDEP